MFEVVSDSVKTPELFKRWLNREIRYNVGNPHSADDHPLGRWLADLFETDVMVTLYDSSFEIVNEENAFYVELMPDWMLRFRDRLTMYPLTHILGSVALDFLD